MTQCITDSVKQDCDRVNDRLDSFLTCIPMRLCMYNVNSYAWIGLLMRKHRKLETRLNGSSFPLDVCH